MALERGNHDLVVLAGSLLIPLFLYSSYAFLAPILAFGVTALKIFPAAGLAPWSFGLIFRGAKSLAQAWRPDWLGSILLLATIFGLTIQLNDIPLILANTPKPDGGASFGLFASYQSKLGSMWLGLVLQKAIIIVASACWFWRQGLTDLMLLRRKSSPATLQAAMLFAIMTSMIYLVSRSWDYRMIFCLGFLPVFANSLEIESMISRRAMQLTGLGIIFIGYEQYLGGRLGAASHYLSDAFVQPLLVGLLIGVLTWAGALAVNSKWISVKTNVPPQ